MTSSDWLLLVTLMAVVSSFCLFVVLFAWYLRLHAWATALERREEQLRQHSDGVVRQAIRNAQ
jgi:hypothetical protein